MHPDHNACGEAVVRAMKTLRKEERPKLHCLAFSHNCVNELGEADIVYDIRKFADKKLAAIKAHRSQAELLVKEMEKSHAEDDPQIASRLHVEKFWTFPF